MLEAYLKGLGLGASLIIAIGAQNAFVLSQGVRRQYNVIIFLICSLSDAILIIAGVAGAGRFFASHPALARIASLGGGLFLLWYALGSFRAFLAPRALDDNRDGPQSLRAAVLFTLAVTWLNPHVYLDTVLLLGSVSSQFAGSDKTAFASGAVSASFLWFFSLSLGGRALSPLFKNPRAWQVLDLIITVIMAFMAYTLLREFFQ